MHDYILIINSYTESTPWSRIYTTPVYERLAIDDDSINAYTEDMNVMMMKTEKDVDNFITELTGKYTKKPPLLIILLGNSSLKHDYTIIHAWNGKEAVEMFKQHEPHIVLMDINMPEMNGYEATEEIRKISGDIPIIAVTAYAFASDEQHIMNSGFDAYTSKPLNAPALKQQMGDLLGKRIFLV